MSPPAQHGVIVIGIPLYRRKNGRLRVRTHTRPHAHTRTHTIPPNPKFVGIPGIENPVSAFGASSVVGIFIEKAPSSE